MTVYVDNMNSYARIFRGGRTISAEWSQLLADDPVELAEFAAALGLLPDWLQAAGTPSEHYEQPSLHDGARWPPEQFSSPIRAVRAT